MCYVYANLCVNLCEGINCYKSLPKHKTIIEDPDNIIQDFKNCEVRFYFITKTIYCAHFKDRTDKIDKIVVYFTVYFCDCSFGEIPIVLQLFGSFGLFSPSLIQDLFAHKDFKRALFSK